MKVLMIASDNNPSSGAFLSMVTLCRLLREEHQVNVRVVVPRPGKGTALLDEAGIPWREVRSFGWIVPKEARGIKERMKQQIKRCLNVFAVRELTRMAADYDLIHINTTYSWVGAAAAHRAGIPLVWHLREFLEEDQNKRIWDRRKGLKLIASADKVVVISGALRDKYAGDIPADKLVMIHNGIDPAAYPAREAPILTGERAVLFYGGGYAEGKGWRELFDALAERLRQGKRDFTLCLLGEMKPEADAVLDLRGLRGVTQTQGYQRDVGRWLNRADIAFSCSACEAFGRKTVEAMMTGALVIAADTGGTLDLIRDGETGLMYHQGDAADLARVIDAALCDRERSRRIADQGMTYAREALTAQVNAERIHQLYESILEKEKAE